MDYSHIQKPELGYRYEFSLEELTARRTVWKRTASQ